MPPGRPTRAGSRTRGPSRPSNNAVFLYDTKDGALHQVTSGYYVDALARRSIPRASTCSTRRTATFDPVYGRFDNTWTYANATRLVAVPLRKDVPSPLAPRNDAEGDDEKDDEKKDDEKKDDGRRTDGRRPKTAKDAAAAKERRRRRDTKDGDKKAGPVPVTSTSTGFEARAVVLPPKAGNYARPRGGQGQAALPPRAADRLRRRRRAPIVFFDLEEREEKTVLDDADGFEVSLDGKKLLVAKAQKFAHRRGQAGRRSSRSRCATADMEAPVDPRAEWRQIFTDAFRFERDFFYDPNMHGVDWARAARALRRRCSTMRSRGGT